MPSRAVGQRRPRRRGELLLPGGGAPAGGGLAVALVVVLLGVAAAGLRSREAARPVATAGPLARHVVVLTAAVAALAVLAGVGLLVTLALTGGSVKGDREQPVPMLGTRWSRPVALLAAVTVISVLVALVQLSITPIRGETGEPRARWPGPEPGSSTGPARTGDSAAPVHGSWLPAAALAGLAVLTAAAAVGLDRSGRLAGSAAGLGDTAVEPQDEPGVLHSAVRAAQRELADPAQDPRSGIVACYDAMEHALAGVGASPGQADTTAEILVRIVSVNPAAGRAAGELTALFREARYSRHSLDAAHLRAAREALAELRRILEAGA